MFLKAASRWLSRLDLPRTNDISQRQLYHLIAAYALISATVISLFPVWLLAIPITTLLLKLASMRYHFNVSKGVAFIILLVSIALITLNFQQFGRQYAGLALLFVFASLKILEAREQRDAFLLMLIYLLLMMGTLMTNKSPFDFFYLIICFLYNIYIQMDIAQPKTLGISTKQNIGSIAKILLVGSPFILILFFLFPRIDPLWQQPGPPQGGQMGLSDEMTPSSLSILAQNGGLAFRVDFKINAVPTQNLLYWRGPVLSRFDGKTWRRDANNHRQNPILHVQLRSKIDYTIYQSGNTENWVLPLDMPGKKTTNTTLNGAYEMRSKTAITQTTAFDLSSFLAYNTGAISTFERRLNSQFPAHLYAKTQALAKDLRAQSQSDEDFADRVLQYLHDNEYYYDLEPTPGNKDIDTFMFTTRVGYCEHYASAFAFMMRSQNVPARVVTGYQGGETNAISGEFEVKQLNAHAWTEVYIDGKGWVRYDPTAAVAPERISSGSPLGVARNSDSASLGDRLDAQSDTYRTMGQTFRALNALWQNWIINYDRTKQNNLLQRFGLRVLQPVIWLVFIIVTAIMIGVLVRYYRRYQQKRQGDSIYQTMQAFLHHLQQHKLFPPADKPLTHWLATQRQALGESYDQAKHIIDIYYYLRFHPTQKGPAYRVEDLKRAIHLFIRRAK